MLFAMSADSPLGCHPIYVIDWIRYLPFAQVANVLGTVFREAREGHPLASSGESTTGRRSCTSIIPPWSRFKNLRLKSQYFGVGGISQDGLTRLSPKINASSSSSASETGSNFW